MVHIISPHIDDAIFSIGGLIAKLARREEEITIHYVFTVSDWTNPEATLNSVHNGGVEVVTQARKREEHNVSALVRHQCDFFDFHDLPLRPANGDDAELQQQVLNKIVSIVRKHEVIFFPVGITHPDHIIVGNIGRKLFDLGYNVMFYEDLPYVARETASHEYLQWLHQHCFESQLERININLKIEMMNLYHSQISNEWLKYITDYSLSPVDHECYERFWRRRKAVMF